MYRRQIKCYFAILTLLLQTFVSESYNRGSNSCCRPSCCVPHQQPACVCEPAPVCAPQPSCQAVVVHPQPCPPPPPPRPCPPPPPPVYCPPPPICPPQIICPPPCPPPPPMVICPPPPICPAPQPCPQVQQIHCPPPPPPCTPVYQQQSYAQNICCNSCSSPCRFIKRKRALGARTFDQQQSFNTRCNSEELRRIIRKNMSFDITSSRQSIQTEVDKLKGNKYSVICSDGDISYSVNTDQYCLETIGSMHCYVFRQ